ncbi:MAG: ATP phosphoribosyltransferase regulatory subunit [Chloroflexota bacterium]|nr:ATP phosphoribosyltransferase regulatory subunit [Chloroflexota bacterium]
MPFSPIQYQNWPLPQGVVDLFFDDAAAKRDLEQELRQLFRTWGYGELIPPTFEYADTLASEGGTQLAEDMYRFVDRDGRTLALRPDLTIPAARVVGTRLFDQPMPLRLCYTGSVFRYEAPQAGRQREFTQAGFELFGAASPEADAEVLALTAGALRLSQVEGFRIVIGQLDFVRGLLGETDASPEYLVELTNAIDRKNLADLEVLVDSLGAAGALRNALLALPRLQGGASVLDEAADFCLNEAMTAALGRLQDIHLLLDGYGLDSVVDYDLGETRGMEYYTGISFKAYAPGLGFAISSGGRYDDLVGHFGPSQPAVGCALWLDRILLVRQRQGRIGPGTRPDLVIAAADNQDCLGLMADLRRGGFQIELELSGRQGNELRQYAAERGIPRSAVCAGDGQVTLYIGETEKNLGIDEVLRETEAW